MIFLTRMICWTTVQVCAELKQCGTWTNKIGLVSWERCILQSQHNSFLRQLQLGLSKYSQIWMNLLQAWAGWLLEQALLQFWQRFWSSAIVKLRGKFQSTISNRRYIMSLYILFIVLEDFQRSRSNINKHTYINK